MRPFFLLSLLPGAVLALYAARAPHPAKAPAVAPDPDNAGLKLPAGFGALKFAETGGKARHLAVAPQGLVYVKLNRLLNGKGIVMLRPQANGRGAVAASFGDYGGTGAYVKTGYLYASSDRAVYRYRLNAQGEVATPNQPEVVVRGLTEKGQHESKSLVLDDANNLYVNVGAYSNACQARDRERGSKGLPNCPILDSAGGIWQFSTTRLNQRQADGTRYATGLRNVVGLDWNSQNNQLFVMQHGRDQLSDNWPQLYNAKSSALLPAECLYALRPGANAGWPYIYYDQLKGAQMLAPEYGGDGQKTVSGKYLDPAAAYPGHMAPNGLLFYTGSQFPARYRQGAFIAFHGSWNRAPEPQAGYFVVFQPFVNGKPSGKWEVFADNFSGSAAKTAAGRADHRPCGLAQGPDGSLYVSDDSKGTIYRIVYTGK